MNKKLKKVIPYLSIFLIAGVLALSAWLLTKDPAHIPESQARSIATKKAEELCGQLATKEDVNCSTLKLAGSDTSTPGITDTEDYYFTFYFFAESRDQKKYGVSISTKKRAEKLKVRMSS